MGKSPLVWWSTMGFLENLKNKIAHEYIQKIKARDIVSKERCPYKVIIMRISESNPDGSHGATCFEKTEYVETEDEADDMGKLEWTKGHEIEIWKLIRRYK